MSLRPPALYHSRKSKESTHQALQEMELYLAPTCEESRVLYEETINAYMSKPLVERDAGLDALCMESQDNLDVGTVSKLHLGVRAAAYDPAKGQFRAFWLLPRSSISKSPLRMANSVGLIDAGYRGPLLGAVDVLKPYNISKGDRYFQIVAADLLPWSAVHIVDEIPGGATLRGEGGFGSTGLKTIKNE